MLHDHTFVPAGRLPGILTLLHLAHHELECPLDVLVVPRRSLGPGAFELLGKPLAFLGRHLALFGAEVGFVAYDDEGDEIGSLLEQRSVSIRR